MGIGYRITLYNVLPDKQKFSHIEAQVLIVEVITIWEHKF